ncbi:MAG: DapH/DapD/GlmU-related protein [Pseudomonadota bacterium]
MRSYETLMAHMKLSQFGFFRNVVLGALRIYLRSRHGIRFAEDVDLSLTTRFVSARRGSIAVGPSSALALHSSVVSLCDDGSTAPVKIGRNCFIGAGAMICPGVTIGDGVIVAAGSVVQRDIPGDCVVSGNPARIVRRGIGAGRYGRLPDAWAGQRLMELAEAMNRGKVSRRSAAETPIAPFEK